MHKILYFSNTKYDFGVIPRTSDRFFKNYSVNIKIAHLTSKSLIFMLCLGSGYLNITHWINQCRFCYKRSSAHRISYFSNTKSNFGTMLETKDRFLKITELTLKLLI